jgi:Bacterial capsule synthesis protein PGA_cap
MSPGPSSFQLALASRLTRSPDITAVIGQHVHIVQPIRTINGKLVVFGEGNLISNQTSACCPAAAQDGMIVLLTLTVDSHGARVSFIRYVPIWVRHPDFVVLPAGTAWRTDPADAAALRASYERTVAAAGRGPRIQPIPAHLLLTAPGSPASEPAGSARRERWRPRTGSGNLERPEVCREQVILPPDLLERIERQVMGVARHVAWLQASGQHLKRGVLLHARRVPARPTPSDTCWASCRASPR